MTIFITGATGFVGRHFFKLLSSKAPAGSTFYILARSAAPSEFPGATLLSGGLEQLEEFRDQLLKSDYVFHIAAKATYGKSAGYKEANTDSTVKLVEILSDSKALKNFIFVSTIGAVDRATFDFCSQPLNRFSNPSPRSVYGRSKLDAENAIRISSIPYTIIRPTWVYGEGMRAKSHIHQFVSMAVKKSGVFKLNFPGKVSLIHVTDLASALCNAIGNNRIIGKTYFGETEGLSLGEILNETWKHVHASECPRSNLPKLFTWVRFFHSLLPLAIANLFADYLYARDPEFSSDFDIRKPILLKDGIRDVINDNVELTGTYIITGAGSGIGLALARRLSGKKLLLIDRETSALGGIPNVKVVKADLSVDGSLDEIAQQVTGRVKALVNNAGVGYKGGLSQLSDDKIKTTLAVNIQAPMLLTKRLSHILQRDGATIVNVASSVGYNPLPGMSVYAASKAFIVSWSESLAYEWQDTNPVVTFSPSGTATNFQKAGGVSTESGKLMSPDQVASLIAQRLDGKGGHFVVGAFSKILILICRFVPVRTAAKIWGGLFARLR